MKFTVASEHLAAAMKAAGSVVEKRTTVPILQNVLLNATAQGLAITGTDLDIQITHKVGAEVEAPGALTVQADALARLLANLPRGATVRVEDLGGGFLQVASGRSRYKLQTLPIEDFPDLAFDKPAGLLSLDEAAMAHLFGRTSFAMSTEETRFYLNGVYLHAKPGHDGAETVRCVATDGHRLALASWPMPEGGAIPAGVIVPRKAVGVVATLFAKGALVKVSPNKIQFERDEVVLTSKLVDGTFPDYERVIPAPDAAATSVTIARDDVSMALRRLRGVQGDSGKGIKFDIANLTASVRNAAENSGLEEIEGEITVTGSVHEIGFNGAYLADILGQFTTEHVAIEMGAPGAPIRVTAVGAMPAYTVVLMPMRV